MMLKDWAKKSIAPLLKQHGFKKNGLTWTKSNNEVVQVIDFQLSRFNGDGEENFTINLGLFDQKIWKVCWAKELPTIIKEEDCFPRIRIGKLLSGVSENTTDLWWTFKRDTNESEFEKEIKILLEGRCLPFLDSMLNYHSVVSYYSSAFDHLMPIEKIYLAIIKYSIGDKNSSAELLSEVSAISMNWASRVDQVRLQLRLYDPSLQSKKD